MSMERSARDQQAYYIGMAVTVRLSPPTSAPSRQTPRPFRLSWPNSVVYTTETILGSMELTKTWKKGAGRADSRSLLELYRTSTSTGLCFRVSVNASCACGGHVLGVSKLR